MVKGICKGSTVVEMAYLMPVVLLMWILIVFTLFYFHDKNIVSGAAYEAAVVGSEKAYEGITKEELMQYFQKRVRGKLLFFGNASAEIELNEEKVLVTGAANKRGMKIKVTQSAVIITPEEELRRRQILKEGLEGIIK